MAKQAKMKKGSIGKKALAAILAASMVLSSSAFTAFAGPNEDNGIMTIAAVQNVYVEVGDHLTYNAKAQELPDLAVYDNKNTVPVPGNKGSKDANAVLIPRDYYDVEYFNNKNAGTGFVTITFKGTYEATGSVTAEFTIEPLTVNNTAKVEYETYTGLTYNGQPQTPKVKSVTMGSVVLNADDYKLVDASSSSDDFIAAGNHKVKLAAGDNGNIAVLGNVGEFDYVITKAPFNKSTINVTTKPAIYTGEPIADTEVEKAVKVTDLTGTEMKMETAPGSRADGYTIVYYDRSDKRLTTAPTDVGTYKILIKRTDDEAAVAGSNYKAGEVESSLEIQYSNLQVEVDEKLEETVDNTPLGNNGPVKGSDGKLTYTYDMKSHCPVADDVKTFLTGAGLSANDFDLDMSKATGTDVGDYEIVVNGKNGLDGKSARIPYSIVPCTFDATSGAYELSTTPEYADGTRIKAAAIAGTASGNVKTTVTVIDKGTGVDAKEKELVKGTDYDVTVGTPYVKKVNSAATKVIDITINAKGNYKNKVTAGKDDPLKLTVAVSDKISLADDSITAEVTGTHYYDNGIQVTPLESEIVVQDTNRGVRLEKDIDYIVSYGSNNTAGEDAGTVTIKAKDSRYYITNTEKIIKFDIAGTDVATRFEIAPIDAKVIGKDEDLKVAGSDLTYLYKGTSNEVDSATIRNAVDENDEKYYKDGQPIEESEFASIDGACVITIEVPASGTYGYTGSLKADYVINGEDVTADVKVDDIPDQNYTGSEIKPAITIFKGSDRLIEGTDYDLYFDNNVNVGTGYVRIVLKGKYSGTIIKTFKITGEAGTLTFADPSQKTLLENGVEVGADDVTLNIIPSVADDTLNLGYASDNTDVATVDASGKISFKGEGTATITVTATSSKTSYAPLKVTVKVVKAGEGPSTGIKTPTITLSRNVSKKAKTFTVSTCKVAGATKWQVQYSLKKARKANGDLKANKTKTYASNKAGRLYRKVITCNKSGKKYYVRVRAYVDGDWSAWSDSEEGLESIKTR